MEVTRVVRRSPGHRVISDRPAGSWEDPELKSRYKKAMSLKEHLGLTDEERYELAQLIIGVDKDDGGSWKDLDKRQLHDLITMMEGWVLIQHLINMRPGMTDR